MKTMHITTAARSTLLSIALTLVSLFSISIGSSAADAAALLSCGGWSIIPSQNVGTNGNYLNSIASLSTRDAWAAGASRDGNNPRTLLEHWNGHSWKVVASPNPSTSYDVLSGLVTISANNAWAVGTYQGSNNTAQPLIVHWNGSSWNVVSAAYPGIGDSPLNSVAATAANDVWTVGTYDGTGATQALVEHWNGSSWNIVPTPSIGLDNSLSSITALSPTNVWAVGDYTTQYGKGMQSHTLVEHWNGSSWSVVTSPNAGSGDNALNGITALSPTNAWSVGYSSNNGGPQQTLTEHWNGSSWSVVSSPTSGSLPNSFNSVVAISTHEVLAAGYNYNSQGFQQTLVEQWSGTTWNIMSTPNVDSNSDMLNGIARVPGTQKAWTVGTTYGSGSASSQTLTEFFC